MDKGSNTIAMNLKDGVSVILPTYKGEKWILKCLNSLEKQTLDKKLFEVIVIINGEKDNTESLIDKFTLNSPTLNVVKIVLKEGGASNARNKGLERSSRFYLTFIDDDDWVSENYLELLYSNASSKKVVFGQFIDINPDGTESKYQRALNELIEESINDKPLLTNLTKSIMVTQSKLIPTNLAKSIQFDTALKSGEDIVYFTKLFTVFDFEVKIINIDKCVIYYRLLRENSISQREKSFQFNIIERLEVIRSLNDILSLTKKEYKQIFIKEMIDEHMGFVRAYLNNDNNKFPKVLNAISSYRFSYFPYYLLVPENSNQTIEIKSLKKNLNDCRHKYKESTSNITSLKEHLNQTKSELNQTKNELNQTKNSFSYKLGYALLYEKTKLINPKVLFGKMSTVKRMWNDKKHKRISNLAPKFTTKETVNKNDAEIYLSTLGWEENIDKDKITVLGIFDEFTHTCFQYHYNLIEPRPDNWRGLIDKYSPKFLFIESTWRGNNGSWQYRVADYANPLGNELKELIEECKNKNIPTIFWNKEDPVHFDNFKHVSELVDFVFTSAYESITNYKQITNANVDVLQFAAEEYLHNPIHTTDRKNAVCFAGSYYANRFKDRREDQLMLLRVGKEYGLEIFDRNYNPDKSMRSDFEFPIEFDNFVVGSLPYSKLVKKYKDYKVFLNVNSIIDSKTMFSRRIFELLACGTPVISTVALGVEETFGKDIVWTVKNKREAKKALETLMNDPLEWRIRSLRGIRSVFNNHTYTHRNEQILNTLFSDASVKSKNCLLLGVINSEDELKRLEELFTYQDSSNIDLEFCIFTDNKQMKECKSERFEIVFCEKNINKEVKNFIDLKKPDYFSVMSVNCVYGKNFINDAIIALTYSKAQFSAKSKNNKDLYDYTDNVFANSIVCNFEKVNELTGFLEKALRLMNFEENNFKNKSIYCADIANFHYDKKVLPNSDYISKIQDIEV